MNVSFTDLDLIVTVLRHNVQKETMFYLAYKSRFDAGFDYFGCQNLLKMLVTL